MWPVAFLTSWGCFRIRYEEGKQPHQFSEGEEKAKKQSAMQRNQKDPLSLQKTHCAKWAGLRTKILNPVSVFTLLPN